jgi:hypothetical protein
MYGSIHEFQEIAVIKKENKVVGFCTNENISNSRFSDDDEFLSTWEEIMEPISPSEILSSNTTLIDLIKMLNNRNDFFLVLDKNEFIGVVFFYNLDCNEMKLCIMSLMFELDKLLDRIIENLKINIKEILSEERINNILEQKEFDIYKNFRNILNNLNFRDKFKILNKIFELEDFDKLELKNFINILQNVRNKIAHGESII